MTEKKYRSELPRCINSF